jgi:hypothetical protein
LPLIFVIAAQKIWVDQIETQLTNLISIITFTNILIEVQEDEQVELDKFINSDWEVCQMEKYLFFLRYVS